MAFRVKRKTQPCSFFLLMEYLLDLLNYPSNLSAQGEFGGFHRIRPSDSVNSARQLAEQAPEPAMHAMEECHGFEKHQDAEAMNGRHAVVFAEPNGRVGSGALLSPDAPDSGPCFSAAVCVFRLSGYRGTCADAKPLFFSSPPSGPAVSSCLPRFPLLREAG